MSVSGDDKNHPSSYCALRHGKMDDDGWWCVMMLDVWSVFPRRNQVKSGDSRAKNFFHLLVL